MGNHQSCVNFKLDWHPASIAEQWPNGSVVLVRLKLKPEWGFSYFLDTDFEFKPFAEEAQYLLVAEPERKQ